MIAQRPAAYRGALQFTLPPPGVTDTLRAFYAEKNPVPYDPRNYGPIRLREEGD